MGKGLTSDEASGSFPVCSARRRARWIVRALALLATLTLSNATFAEDKPARGTWKQLASRRFSVDRTLDAALVDRRLDDIVRALKPEGAQISELAVVPQAHGAKISFRASMRVNVSLGPFRVAKNASFVVRANATSGWSTCTTDASRRAYQIRLDLSQSDEPVSANADAFVASVCLGNDPGTLELTTFMQVGPDYGTRGAGRLATDLLARQTEPMVRALQSAVASQAMAAATP